MGFPFDGIRTWDQLVGALEAQPVSDPLNENGFTHKEFIEAQKAIDKLVKSQTNPLFIYINKELKKLERKE